MDNKKTVLFLLVAAGVCLAGVFFLKAFFTPQTTGDYRNMTDMESVYHAETEIAQALERLKNSREKAGVITHSSSGRRQIALTFDGLTDHATIQQILNLLHTYNAQATFFVDGVQTAEEPQSVADIKQQGHKVENYTLSGLPKMEALPVERLVADFSRAQKIIKVTTDQEPNLLKCNDTKYTDSLLRAARACGFNSLVKSDVFLNVQQINSLANADDFVSQLKPGNIVSVKLKTNVEPPVNEAGRTDLKPAVDKQPGLKELQQKPMTEKKDIVGAVEKLLAALQKANYTTTFVENFSKHNLVPKPGQTTFRQNGLPGVIKRDSAFVWVNIASALQKQITDFFSCRTAYAAERELDKAEEIKMVFTTEPAIAFTFGGLSNRTAVDDVLNRLQALGIKATFFVMEIEMQRYPETVRKIIANGHEIGIAIRPKEGENFDEIRQRIVRSRNLLREQFGVTTNLVKQPWGVITDITKEAIQASGCQMIGQSVNVVQSKHKDYSSADQVMAEIFGKATFSLARGQIVHFRMDYYANDRLAGDLIEAIKQRKVDNIAYATFYDNPASNPANDSQYVIKPVGAILHNSKFIYQYPVDPARIPERLRSGGARKNNYQHNFLSEVSKRYIGNDEVVYEDRMLGFSKMDTRRLDKSGLIHTKDNVIFLTFDDWGTDASINKILYVLRKHHVAASFFVITNNVLNNPNLLRSIAMQGNDIGSHSEKHKPMAIRDLKTGKQVATQNKEEYTEDLATSYKKLSDVTGDVVVNGKPSLTRFFRPPTLAISKMGLATLLETGYEYIISGSTSTYDYKAESVSELIETIKKGIYTQNGELKKGAILVMHMTDSSRYTAVALDILLTANEAKDDSDPSKFKVGRLSDYLTDGYSQIKRY
ncbi:putative secreted protein [Propionispora sp. 2/2-37]|uniref:polysaccharide deacetylase family protein n=1 Tax=Propionispora sp. 2/2-37 TaxID=1677858 RepID=UPI0006BB54C0|nr:polysaccharide deacetylase family protein [Propionispora sp. 2/2-37]CUH97627.1 putative secreted protein [Propionispora sp. 2/2-37]